MAVNITDSVGYEGTVDEPQWARLMAYAGGRQYGVLGASDWKVSAGTADREVRVAAGSGFGAGILDRTTATASLTLPAPGSGSRWHLIIVRRDWQNNRSSFDTIAGGQGAPSIPARGVTPGTGDDQPLALVQVTAGQTQVTQIIDLRVWGGDGGAFAVDELVLQYLNRLGTRVNISGIEWRREMDVFGSLVWAKKAQPQGAALEAVLTGTIAQPGSTNPLLNWTVPNIVPAGALLHVRADLEIWIPTGESFAGFAQVRQGATNVIGQRRWSNHYGRNQHYLYTSVEVNTPITQDIPAGTEFRFVLTSDVGSVGGVEAWHAYASWAVTS